MIWLNVRGCCCSGTDAVRELGAGWKDEEVRVVFDWVAGSGHGVVGRGLPGLSQGHVQTLPTERRFLSLPAQE